MHDEREFSTLANTQVQIEVNRATRGKIARQRTVIAGEVIYVVQNLGLLKGRAPA